MSEAGSDSRMESGGGPTTRRKAAAASLAKEPSMEEMMQLLQQMNVQSQRSNEQVNAQLQQMNARFESIEHRLDRLEEQSTGSQRSSASGGVTPRSGVSTATGQPEDLLEDQGSAGGLVNFPPPPKLGQGRYPSGSVPHYDRERKREEGLEWYSFEQFLGTRVDPTASMGAAQASATLMVLQQQHPPPRLSVVTMPAVVEFLIKYKEYYRHGGPSPMVACLSSDVEMRIASAVLQGRMDLMSTTTNAKLFDYLAQLVWCSEEFSLIHTAFEQFHMGTSLLKQGHLFLSLVVADGILSGLDTWRHRFMLTALLASRARYSNAKIPLLGTKTLCRLWTNGLLPSKLGQEMKRWSQNSCPTVSELLHATTEFYYKKYSQVKAMDPGTVIPRRSGNSFGGVTRSAAIQGQGQFKAGRGPNDNDNKERDREGDRVGRKENCDGRSRVPGGKPPGARSGTARPSHPPLVPGMQQHVSFNGQRFRVQLVRMDSEEIEPEVPETFAEEELEVEDATAVAGADDQLRSDGMEDAE